MPMVLNLILQKKIFQKSILIKNNAIKAYIKNIKAGEDIQPFGKNGQIMINIFFVFIKSGIKLNLFEF